MVRKIDNWLQYYVKTFAQNEAPKKLHFWTGISTLAGALRRKVWLDMKIFKWYPNFYIVLVAPPAIAQKSTAAGLGMLLLKEVDGPLFGPDTTTWQALSEAFSEAYQEFICERQVLSMSALSLEVTELGTFLDFSDTKLISFLIATWDGKEGESSKRTIKHGVQKIMNPCINMIGCTTPDWLQENIPDSAVNGGLISRMVFVFAKKKERIIAYTDETVADDWTQRRVQLKEDLQHIAYNVAGPMTLSPEAREFGRDWYNKIMTDKTKHLFDNHFARRQTQTHKLAMLLSVSESDNRIIEYPHLKAAVDILDSLEEDSMEVFSYVGRARGMLQIEKLFEYIKYRGAVHFDEAYKYVFQNFPTFRDFSEALYALIKSKRITYDANSKIISVNQED